MWTSFIQKVDRQTTKTTLSNSSGALSFGEVIELWNDSKEFREYFTTIISQSAFDAFFWETPPVTDATLGRPFEFVLVEGASLSRLKPDPTAFRAHFSTRAAE